MLRFLLINGDSRQVMPYIKTESIDLIVTSPPYYGIVKYSDSHPEGEIGVTGTLKQYIYALTDVFYQCYRVLKPTGLFMLNIDNSKRQDGFPQLSAWEWIPILKQLGFKLTQTIIWTDADRRKLYNPKLLNHYYEPIFILAKTKNYTFHWNATQFQGDVWNIQHYRGHDRDKGDIWDRTGIATFPVTLIDQLIKLGSNPNDTTLDPFAGSGTVMDVSQRLNRNNISIEINLQFCERIMERCFDKNPLNQYRFLTQSELAKP